MASLSLTFQDLYTKVSKYLGTYGTSGPNTTELDNAKEIVNDAYRRFIDNNPDWSFLKPLSRIDTVSGTYTYELPNDYIRMVRPFQYDADSGYPEMIEVSLSDLIEMRSVNDFQSYPEYYAIYPTEYTKETGQRWEVKFYPTPDSSYSLFYTYKMYPTLLENDNDIPVGALDYSDCIRQLCLAEAESNVEENNGTQEEKAKAALFMAITNDRRKNPHTLGYNGDGTRISDWDVARGSYRVNDVNFET